MATQQEIAEVRAFLDVNDGEWLDMDCRDAEEACPSLLHRKEDESDPLAYHINSVCSEAGLSGGIEEHGHGDWLCLAKSRKKPRWIRAPIRSHYREGSEMSRPGIIVVCPDDADCFDWLSDGWYQTSIRHTPEAQKLMAKAKGCIEDAEDVPDAIKRLEEAGFAVRREL